MKGELQESLGKEGKKERNEKSFSNFKEEERNKVTYPLERGLVFMVTYNTEGGYFLIVEYRIEKPDITNKFYNFLRTFNNQ